MRKIEGQIVFKVLTLMMLITVRLVCLALGHFVLFLCKIYCVLAKIGHLQETKIAFLVKL